MKIKNLKGASPLGGMLLAVCIMLIAAYSILGFMGTFQISTGEQVNASLAAQYNSILGVPGRYNPTTGIFSKVPAFSNNVTANNGTPGSGLSGLGSVISGSFNPLGLGEAMINVMIVAPLKAVGIPVSYAWTIALMLFGGFIILLTVSALLIFNLL